MRVVVQRVRSAAVLVAGSVAGQIGPGLLALVGFGRGDGEKDIEYLCEKLVSLRVFPDERALMNRSLLETGGGLLVVSQFTLYGDCRKGRRPGFDDAMEPELAEQCYRQTLACLSRLGIPPQQGVFGAAMEVHLVNDGPVTLLLDSKKQF